MIEAKDTKLSLLFIYMDISALSVIAQILSFILETKHVASIGDRASHRSVVTLVTLCYMFLSGHIAVLMLWLASGIKTTWLVLEKHHVKV